MPPTPRPTAHPARAAVFGLALGAALLAAPATAAHAQFGGLLKRAAAAAAEKAGAGAKDAAAGKAGERAGIAAPTGGALDASLLDITPERLDAFVAGMRGPVEGARRRVAAEAAYKAWTTAKADFSAKDAAHDACEKSFLQTATPQLNSAVLKRMSRVGERLPQLAMRQSQAQAAGNTRLADQLQDSLTVLGAEYQELQTPGITKACGAPPRRPSDTRPAEGPRADDPAFRPALPAGMTPTQFGLLRERVAAWLLATDKRYTYSDQEQQALESRRAALAPLTPFFRDRSVEWRSVTAGFEAER
jgi:hypothetical protein